MPVSTVKLTTNYEAGPAWWESGGLDLWAEFADEAGETVEEDEIEIPATDAAKFLVRAAQIPGWESGPVDVDMESDAVG